MTAPEKGRWYWVRNWLHYHWVYLVIAAVVLWVGISWLANALHWGETLPDYQIAYVGKNSLPEDTARAIENAFAQYGEDLNGDGVVAPDVTRTDAEATAVELDHVDESATVEQGEAGVRNKPSQALPRQLSRRESQAVKLGTKALDAMRKFTP